MPSILYLRNPKNGLLCTIKGGMHGGRCIYQFIYVCSNRCTPSFPYTVKLYCQRSVEANPQTVVISCTSERMLNEVLCSVNNAPMKPCMLGVKIIMESLLSNCIHFHAGELPWRVDITSLGASEFRFQVNVTDSLNLTDSAIIEYQGRSIYA